MSEDHTHQDTVESNAPHNHDALRSWAPDRPLLCACGYDRKGLASDAICPECGSLKLKWTLGARIYAAKQAASATAKAAWRVSIFTTVLTTLVVVWFVIMLVSAMNSVGANFGPLLPMVFWVWACLPATVVAVILIIVAKASGDTTRLPRYAAVVLSPSIVIALLLVCLFILAMLWRM